MRLRLPEFLDNRHMKVASFSAVRTGRFYSPPTQGEIPGAHFCQRLSRFQDHSATLTRYVSKHLVHRKEFRTHNTGIGETLKTEGLSASSFVLW